MTARMITLTAQDLTRGEAAALLFAAPPGTIYRAEVAAGLPGPPRLTATLAGIAPDQLAGVVDTANRLLSVLAERADPPDRDGPPSEPDTQPNS